MRGGDEVLALLNEQLTSELTAINQYFLHAKMQANWGFTKLAEHTRKEPIEEMRHAGRITDRILFLEGLPNYQKLLLRIHRLPRDQPRVDRHLGEQLYLRSTGGADRGGHGGQPHGQDEPDQREQSVLPGGDSADLPSGVEDQHVAGPSVAARFSGCRGTCRRQSRRAVR
jgi:hypothetical protein